MNDESARAWKLIERYFAWAESEAACPASPSRAGFPYDVAEVREQRERWLADGYLAPFSVLMLRAWSLNRSQALMASSPRRSPAVKDALADHRALTAWLDGPRAGAAADCEAGSACPLTGDGADPVRGPAPDG